jgi:HAD superfamily hydrolase (TIGR01509 family)
VLDPLISMPLPFTPGGLIFDCDGTLADTMPLHYQAWRATLDRAGYPTVFTNEQFYAWAGAPAYEILERLAEQHQVTLELTALTHEKERAYQKLIPQLTPIEPVLAEVRRFSGAVPMAVVSGGMRELVEETLDILGIRDRFEIIIGSGEVTKGKPDPEGMLLAARTLGVAPQSCVVYEDGAAGIEAARRAGMRVVDITKFIG